MNEQLRVSFDCDGTLLERAGNAPRYKIIDKLLWYREIGASIYIQSGSGVDYARMVARRLGLDNIAYCIPKWGLQVDIAHDDEPAAKAQEGKTAKVVVIV